MQQLKWSQMKKVKLGLIIQSNVESYAKLQLKYGYPYHNWRSKRKFPPAAPVKLLCVHLKANNN